MSKSRDKAYEIIREAVLNGTFQPGERLIESKLVELVGVSRTPIREAIKQLAAENYLVMKTNSGAAVANWNDQEMADVFKLRAMTEGLIAQRAAEKISEEQIGELKACADTIDTVLETGQPYNIRRFLHENSKFHETIVTAADSLILSRMLAHLISPPIVFQIAHNFTAAELARSNSHHREIIDSMVARDGDWACHAMQSHVMSAYNRMRSIRSS